MVYFLTCSLAGNQIFMLAAVMAHNLNGELQMLSANPVRNTTEERAPL